MDRSKGVRLAHCLIHCALSSSSTNSSKFKAVIRGRGCYSRRFHCIPSTAFIQNAHHRGIKPMPCLFGISNVNLRSIHSTAPVSAKDYYDTLGVNKRATASEIRKAYLGLIKKWHPDVSKDDPKAAKNFQEVQKAWEVLRDEDKRAEYDQVGHEAFEQQGDGGNPGFHPVDGFGPFGDMFKMHDIFNGDKMGGQDIKVAVEISFMEAVIGGGGCYNRRFYCSPSTAFIQNSHHRRIKPMPCPFGISNANLRSIHSTAPVSAKDYYDGLGVNKSATASEIKKAYLRLVKKWHPDVSKDDPEAAQKFHEVQKAWEVLRDEDKRAEYDQVGHEAFEQQGDGGDPGGGFGPFGDMFKMHDIFNDDKMGGQDIKVAVEISFMEAVQGTTKSVSFEAPVLSQTVGVIRDSSIKRRKGMKPSIQLRISPGKLISRDSQVNMANTTFLRKLTTFDEKRVMLEFFNKWQPYHLRNKTTPYLQSKLREYEMRNGELDEKTRKMMLKPQVKITSADLYKMFLEAWGRKYWAVEFVLKHFRVGVMTGYSLDKNASIKAWDKPKVGQVIFNVDASVKEVDECYTWAWILRDSRGFVLAMLGGFLDKLEIMNANTNLPDNNAAEIASLARATIDAFKLLESESYDASFSSVVIACDSAKAVEELNGVDIAYKSTQEILSSARLKLSSMRSRVPVEVRYVPRGVNRLVDYVTKNVQPNGPFYGFVYDAWRTIEDQEFWHIWLLDMKSAPQLCVVKK